MSRGSVEIGTGDDEFIGGAALATCLASLAVFLDRYKPKVHRVEQEEHMEVYIEGLVSGIERKSIEPIATAHGLYRRPLQHFVGAGAWSDDRVRTEMRDHIVKEIGDPAGVLILDGSGVKKQGSDSVGVTRQYCGRLGKIENCQVGIYLAYSTPRGFTLLDTDLYLPKDWSQDEGRREKTYVPHNVQFRTNWQIADELLLGLSPHVPHAWIVGDDEYGRPTEFRDRLADRHERYLLEVPCNTQVRRPINWPGRARMWCSVSMRKKRHPPDRWERITIRDGEKGPIEVLAFCTRVETRRTGSPPREETLLVMQTLNGSQTWYFLAPKDAPVNATELVRVAAHRHHIEQAFQFAKGECGLAHYEVRSWVGWQHHMTLSMLALWFLTLERRRMGKKLRH
jgi:SRSO17 transposase